MCVISALLFVFTVCLRINRRLCSSQSVAGLSFVFVFNSSWDENACSLSLWSISLYDKKLFWCDAFSTIGASSIAAPQTAGEALIWSVRGYKYRKYFNLQQMKTFICTLKSLRWANQCNILEKKDKKRKWRKNIQVARGCVPQQMKEETELQRVLYSFLSDLIWKFAITSKKIKRPTSCSLATRGKNGNGREMQREIRGET